MCPPRRSPARKTSSRQLMTRKMTDDRMACMNWLKFLEAAIAASFLASMTDWYFFGVLFHDRYHVNAGVWKKYKNKSDEMRSIMVGTIYGSFTCVIFVAGLMT